MSTERLQRGMDAGVGTQDDWDLIGKSLIFVELWKWRRVSCDIVLHEFHIFRHAAVLIIID